MATSGIGLAPDPTIDPLKPLTALKPTAPMDTNPSIIAGGSPYGSPTPSPVVPDPVIPATPTLPPSGPTDPTPSIPSQPISLAPSNPTDPTPSIPTSPNPSITAQLQNGGGVSDGTPLPALPQSPLTLASTTPNVALAPMQPTDTGGSIPTDSGIAPLAAAPITAPPIGLASDIPSPTIATPDPVNRIKLAQDEFSTFAKSSDPYYQKTLRDATSSAAAGGRLGSGMLRTSLGDAASNRELQLDSERDRLMQGATEGSITDASTAYAQQLSSAQAKIDAQYKAGTLSLAQRNQALAELTQSQSNTNDQQRIQLAKDQLAQTGAQFGLSLAQQKDLATLADKTQNRQLDITTAYGQNTLLLELARIMGGTSGNVDPNFIAAVAKSLGMTMPDKAPATPNPVTPPAPGGILGGNGGIDLGGTNTDPLAKGGKIGLQQPFVQNG